MTSDEGGRLDRQTRLMIRARLLDLRSYIAALFAIFGVIVTLSGIFATPAEIAKAQGINISLWTGLAMLLLSAGFTVWLFRAPPEVPQPHEPLPDAGEPERRKG